MKSNRLPVQRSHNLIQPTDLYPDIAKGLWNILLMEKINVLISILPYLPAEYIRRASEESAGKLDILSVFAEGPLNTFFKFRRTNYYHILKFKNKTNFLSLCIYVIKFYRYFRYTRKEGLDLRTIFHDHQKRDPFSHLGTIVNCAIETVLPTKEFIAYDKEILLLFDKNIFSIILGLKNTSYFYIQRNKRKKTLKQTLKWIYKYYKLYSAIKRNGYKIVNKGLKSVPWLFVSKKVTMRLDGHHRCAVATHLKIKEIPVLLITLEDLANHSDVSHEFFTSLL